MLGYRAYMLGRDGHLVSATELRCADDKAAIEYAKQLLDGHDVELWSGKRFVARLDRKPEQGWQDLSSPL